MNNPFRDSNYLGSYLLVITSAGLLLVIGITDRRDITSAAVVISAMILFLTGIFLFTLVKKGSLDNRYTSLMQVQSQINICRIASDLGIRGNAWLLPAERVDQNSVIQFIPVTSYTGGLLEGNSFVAGSGGNGMLIPPAGAILMSDMKKKTALLIPDTIDEILILIRELSEDLLEVADTVQVQKTGNGISIVLNNYLLIEGCRAATSESPACCLMNPCPVCSLFGMIICEGTNTPIMIERCRPDTKAANVEILFTVKT